MADEIETEGGEGLPEYIVENAKSLALGFAHEDAVVVGCLDGNGREVFVLGCINTKIEGHERHVEFVPYARMFTDVEEVDQLQTPTFPPSNVLYRRPRVGGPADPIERHRQRWREVAEEAEARRAARE